MKRAILIALCLMVILSLASCQKTINLSQNQNQVTDVTIEKKPVQYDEGQKGEQTMSKEKIAVIETNKGTFKFKLYTEDAPITTENFINLANSKFYDGLTFHRYEPGFVIQGGDPKGDGSGGSENKIKLEINPKLTHVKGALGMARSQHPDSASSQFYVALEDSHFLDENYAVFGQVTEGMDVVQSLRVGDKMISVKIV